MIPSTLLEHLRRLVVRRLATSIGEAVGSWARVEPVAVAGGGVPGAPRPVPRAAGLGSSPGGWATDLQIAESSRVEVSLVRLVPDGLQRPLDGVGSTPTC